MTKKFISLVTGTVALSAMALVAQEETTKPAEGTMTLSKKTFHLAHGVAYESSAAGEVEIAVVLSAQLVSSEKMRKALKAEREVDSASFRRRTLNSSSRRPVN